MSDGTFAIVPPDTSPPEFEFSVTPTILWPPNHKMVLISDGIQWDVDYDDEHLYPSTLSKEGHEFVQTADLIVMVFWAKVVCLDF